MKQYINTPNCITASRIIGALCLFFTEPFGRMFYIIYTLCGITDALDGFIARMTNKASEFGAKLDSISDLFFYTALLIKIFPFLWDNLPIYVWIVTFLAVIIRICSYMTALLRYRKFASLHTYLNKLTGFALFSVPYLIKIFDLTLVCLCVSIIACMASIEEFVIHITSKGYSEGKQSIILNKNKEMQDKLGEGEKI